LKRTLNSWLIAWTLALGALPTLAGPAVSRPTQTRASHLASGAAGMACVMHMADYLSAYRSSRTAIFAYLAMDSPDCLSLIHHLRSQSQIQDEMGRQFWPQLCLETRSLGLAEFSRDIARESSLTYKNVHALARTLAAYRDQGKWFFIRPFCEMNDATQTATWEFGQRRYRNTPADFALAWKRLRDAFDEEGASNALFIFSPLAAYGVHRESETLAALNMIPAGYIDAFGLNVYSRPMACYGGTSREPVSFEQLVLPWLRLLDASNQRGVPLAIPEMGVSNQATDSARAAWLRKAFKFARAHNFVLITYFNYHHRYWQIDPDTLAGRTLKDEIELY
jgi:hypothetical protein